MSTKRQKTTRGGAAKGASTSGTQTRAGRGGGRHAGRSTAHNEPVEEDPFSHQFFTSDGAARFKKYKDKSCLRERGIDVGFFDYNKIRANIQQRQWGPFCKGFPKSGFPSLAREFFANVPDQRDGHVYVRGIWVPFSAELINGVLEVPNIPTGDDQYERFLLADKDYDAILSRICMPGAQWVRPRNGDHEILKMTTNIIPRAWYFFLASRLLPTEHHTTLTQDRVYLLYAILEGMPMDVGRIVRDNIIHVANGHTTGHPAHPLVITMLCYHAGVLPDPTESQIRAKATIDVALIGTYEEPYLPPDPADEQEVAPPPPPVAAPPPLPPTEWMRYIAAQNTHLMDYHARHAAFEVEQRNSWMTMFGQLNINVDFPMPPPFYPFTLQPPEGPGEDDGAT